MNGNISGTYMTEHFFIDDFNQKSIFFKAHGLDPFQFDYYSIEQTYSLININNFDYLINVSPFDLKEKSKPATVESLTLTGKDGLIVEHDDGSVTNMTFEDTKMALEIHKRLNNTNKEKFEKTFTSSNEKAQQMIQYFQERLKRDLV